MGRTGWGCASPEIRRLVHRRRKNWDEDDGAVEQIKERSSAAAVWAEDPRKSQSGVE
jgi:hypothetical protein